MSAGRCEPAGHERDGSAAAAQRLRPWFAGDHDHRPGRRAHRRRGDAGWRVGFHRKAGRPQRAAGQHCARARAVAGCDQAPGLARSGGWSAGEPHATAARGHGSSLGRPPEQEHRGRSRHQPADRREPSCRGHAQGGRVVAAGAGPTGGRRRRTWVVSEAAKPRSTASNFAPRPVTSRGWRQSASVRPPPGRRTWEKLTMAGPTGALTHADARIDPSTTKVHLVGGGIASLAAAAFFIRDGGHPRPQYHRLRGTRDDRRQPRRLRLRQGRLRPVRRAYVREQVRLHLRAEAMGAVFAAWNAPELSPGTISLITEDPGFLAWMRRSRASGVLVRPDRFIVAKLAPGLAPAWLTPFRTPTLVPTSIALGEAA